MLRSCVSDCSEKPTARNERWVQVESATRGFARGRPRSLESLFYDYFIVIASLRSLIVDRLAGALHSGLEIISPTAWTNVLMEL